MKDVRADLECEDSIPRLQLLVEFAGLVVSQSKLLLLPSYRLLQFPNLLLQLLQDRGGALRAHEPSAAALLQPPSAPPALGSLEARARVAVGGVPARVFPKPLPGGGGRGGRSGFVGQVFCCVCDECFWKVDQLSAQTALLLSL